MSNQNNLQFQSSSNDSTHPLGASYTWWFLKKSGRADINDYEKNLIKLGTCNTVESFWALYQYLVRPNQLPPGSDIMLFREGVKPIWEDPNNTQGGRFIIRSKKGASSRIFENLLLAFIGEYFGSDNEICGIVCSNKFNENILAVWNKHSLSEINIRNREILKHILEVSDDSIFEYKQHDTSLQLAQLRITKDPFSESKDKEHKEEI